MKMNQKVKKMIAVLLGVLMLLSLAACGSESDVTVEEKSGTKAVEKTEDTEESITLKFLYIWPEYEATMTKTIDAFEAENPNINVEVAVVPWDQVRKVLQTRIASGDQPDVTFMWPHQMGTYIENGQALDLTSYMTEDWKSGFSSETVLLKDVKSDKLYNIPFKGTAPIIFYNKDMYEENNIEFPAYVEDIPISAEILKEKDITMFGLAGKPDGFNIGNMIKQLNYADSIFNLKVSETAEWQSGRNFSEDMAQSYTDAMSVVGSWYENGYVDRNMMTQTSGEVQTLFANGQVSCIIGNNNELNSLKNLVDFNIGIATSPTYKSVNQKVLLGATFDGFFASNSTEHPDEAVALLKFLTSKEVQEMWVDECNATPVVKGVDIVDPELASVAQLFEYFVPVQQVFDYTADNSAVWAIQAETLLKKGLTEQDYIDYGRTINEYYKSMAEEYDANK